MSGINIRLSKIFNAESNRSFIVAFDHGQSLPIPAGLGNPVSLLARIAEGKPEGILLNRGMLEQGAEIFSKPGAPEPIVRADWTTLDPRMKEETGEAYRVLVSPERALSLGATATCTYLIGRPKNNEMFPYNVEQVANYIGRAHEVGLPVIVEATLWGLRNENQKDPELLRQMCRIAAEIGADAIKTEYVGDIEAQRNIIDEVGNIPVLTLGGKADSRDAVRTAAAEAIESGARGLIFGRNVWQTDDMAGVMRDLNEIVHEV
ncbi:MAG TPA: fructose-bisphosphate aldolase [Actinomyces sp.]|jgi:class I fructose-bisphosphate aldolase|nr:fructose-bisphosphate aldolase [Acidobacteriota bacterium]HHT40344.1 fructose-bisphosphate aldolase [Actinomyces sp.]